MFINLTPVVAVASAFVLLGERLTLAQGAAAVVVVAGVWLTNSGRGGGETGEPELRSPSAG